MSTSNNQKVKRFREILRRFEREVFVQNNDSCCNGVTLAQCHTLLEIESKKKESVSELAKTLGLDKSTISRTVDGLVNIGLLDREIPKENRRMSTLSLTKAGENICQSIHCNSDQYFNEILSILTPSEQEEMIRLFEKITSQMMQLRSSRSTSEKI